MIYNSRQWLNDIKEVLTILPELNSLEGKSVLITGVSGLICSALTDVLIHYNEMHKRKIRIIAAGRSEERMRARFGFAMDKDYIQYVQYNAALTDNQFTFPCDYIIHGASNAFPEIIMREPVETMLGNFIGMKYLLDYARRSGTKKILYVSSSEVYGKKEGDALFLENEYGYIDLLDFRNSYSIGKRAAETLCVSYAFEYGVESVIARPGHIYGPTASPCDNRVSSIWAYAAANGKDIVMKSEGTQLRSYCYCLDCASAILKILLKGESVHAYNISNPNSIVSIKDMAEIYAMTAGVKLVRTEATEREKKGFNPMNNSSLDSTSLQALGWRGLFDAKRGGSHTVSILKEMIGKTEV